MAVEPHSLPQSRHTNALQRRQLGNSNPDKQARTGNLYICPVGRSTCGPVASEIGRATFRKGGKTRERADKYVPVCLQPQDRELALVNLGSKPRVKSNTSLKVSGVFACKLESCKRTPIYIIHRINILCQI